MWGQALAFNSKEDSENLSLAGERERDLYSIRGEREEMFIIIIKIKDNCTVGPCGIP
jgi:hypothetical protein